MSNNWAIYEIYIRLVDLNDPYFNLSYLFEFKSISVIYLKIVLSFDLIPRAWKCLIPPSDLKPIINASEKIQNR